MEGVPNNENDTFISEEHKTELNAILAKIQSTIDNVNMSTGERMAMLADSKDELNRCIEVIFRRNTEKIIESRG